MPLVMPAGDEEEKLMPSSRYDSPAIGLHGEDLLRLPPLHTLSHFKHANLISLSIDSRANICTEERTASRF